MGDIMRACAEMEENRALAMKEIRSALKRVRFDELKILKQLEREFTKERAKRGSVDSILDEIQEHKEKIKDLKALLNVNK